MFLECKETGTLSETQKKLVGCINAIHASVHVEEGQTARYPRLHPTPVLHDEVYQNIEQAFWEQPLPPLSGVYADMYAVAKDVFAVLCIIGGSTLSVRGHCDHAKIITGLKNVGTAVRNSQLRGVGALVVRSADIEKLAGLERLCAPVATVSSNAGLDGLKKACNAH